MDAPASSLLSPDRFTRFGNTVLILALAISLGLLLLLIWQAPEALPFVPVLTLALAGGLLLFRYPLVNLTVVLLGFIALTDYSTGIQLIEIVYGLYFMAFMAYWTLTHVFVYKTPLLVTLVDKAIFGLLVLVTLYIPIGYLFGAKPILIFNEWSAFILLAIYFPIKQAISQDARTARFFLIALGVIGTFVAVRNLINYQQVLLAATQAWQVSRGRVATNDNLLMVSSVFGLILVIFARGLKPNLAALGLFGLFFSGLILTQSRGYWLAFLFAAGCMFLIVPSAQKQRILLIIGIGSAALLGLAVLLFGDVVLVVFFGLTERLASLKTAVTTDISLVNRFKESAAAWQHIKVNPILGYGMGVPYVFYDIVHESTDVDAFVHNGYLSIWYKFGIVGLALTLTAWAGAAWHGIRAFRLANAPAPVRFAGIVSACALAGFSISAITSNPYYVNDTLFMLGFLMGLGSGAYQYAFPKEASSQRPEPTAV